MEIQEKYLRTNPEEPEDDPVPSGIIYLGDVRRRRNQDETTDRHYLFGLIALAWVAWTLWLTVLVTLPPQRLLTYLAFFTPLFVALATTATLVAYVVEWRIGPTSNLRRSLCRGLLVSAIVVLNLAFGVAHHWSVLVLGVTVLMGAAADLSRERQSTTPRNRRRTA